MTDIPSSFHDEWLRLSLSIGPHPPVTELPSLTNNVPVPMETCITPLSHLKFHEEPSFSVVPSLPLPPDMCEVPSSQNQGLPDAASSSRKQWTGRSRPARSRKSPAQTFKRAGKTEIITPPYSWATNRRAHVHTLEYLTTKGINKISGEVQCKRCERKNEIEYDLEERFLKVANFIAKYKYSMHDRAPSVWKHPSLTDCNFCGEQNCVMPTTYKKRSVNWLFLLLGQKIGCCNLSELKYFCKHNNIHRTGAKDRLLYLTYLGLCKQLDPYGSFDL